MAEDLQALIERLQRDAVDEGQNRARAIVAEAEARAAALIREAEATAADRLARAERDAETFAERGEVALEQAGRDLLIVVRQALERLLDGAIRESLEEELRPSLLAEMLVKMAGAYASQGGRERRMAVLLGRDDLDEMARLYAQRYRDRLAMGVELRLDEDVDHGFRVVMVDDHVEHDFTIDAIAQTLSQHLRPHLARILLRSAAESEAAATTRSAAPHEPEPSR
jgi:V/A-type H+/Na+-transporting ATPase subunit E